MACKRIKIRNLEVVQRRTVDDVPSKRKIPRTFSRKVDDSNCESQMSTATNYETDCHDIHVDLGNESCENEFDWSCSSQLPTMYSLERSSAERAWASVRSSLLDAIIQSSALPSQVCSHCHEDPVEFRCLQCEPSARYYCKACLHEHIQVHYLHSPEVWKVRT